MKVRVPRTSWHTVQAQHRALATMGKLAAEHSKGERPEYDPSSSKSAVRVVRDDASRVAPAAPPALRSRPRRSSSGGIAESKDADVPNRPAEKPAPGRPMWGKEVPRSPSVKLVRELSREPLRTEISRSVPAVPRAELPVIPTMRPLGTSAGTLRFDALAPPAPLKTEVARSSAAKPSKTADAHLQFRKAVAGANRAATRAVHQGRAAFSALLVRCGAAKSTVVSGGRSMLAVLSRQPRALTGAAAGLLLLVAIAGLAAIGGGNGTSNQTTAGAQRPSPRQAPATGPAQQNGAAQQAAGTPASLLEMTSSTSAVYQVTGPISVVLDASGRCWIEARRSGRNGGLLFQGTLVPGQTWTVAGPTWLRLGNPAAVSLMVNGEPVNPPAARGMPFDLQIG